MKPVSSEPRSRPIHEAAVYRGSRLADRTRSERTGWADDKSLKRYASMPFHGAETRRRLRTPALTYEGAAPECTIFIRFLPQSSGAISNTMRFLGNDWICYTVHVSNTTSLLLLECRMAERIHKHRLCTKRHLIYNAQVINYIFDNRCPTLIPHSRNYYAAQRDKCN